MENKEPKTQEQMLEEILKYTKQTRNYMKWQFIIMIALVVIPLFAALFVIPYALKSLSETYSGALIQ